MRRCEGMGKLVFGMMQSLDGYVAGAGGGPGSDGYVAAVAGGLELPPPGVSLSGHFNDHVRGLAGSLYGRRMYEVMRYWDEDRPEPRRPRSHRRVSSLLPPLRAWPRQAVLRRCQATTPPCRHWNNHPIFFYRRSDQAACSSASCRLDHPKTAF